MANGGGKSAKGWNRWREVGLINPKKKTPRDSGLDRIGTARFWSELMRSSLDDEERALIPRNNNFVAAVFTGEIPDISFDFVTYPRMRTANDPQHDRAPHVGAQSLDTLAFPLIYLHGESSWGYYAGSPRGGPPRPGGADDVFSNSDDNNTPPAAGSPYGDGRPVTPPAAPPPDDKNNNVDYRRRNLTIVQHARYSLGRRNEVSPFF